ncbi:hypothetical protein [Mucilaginibacter lappiensis]|uniref:Bacterial transglutaminase-like N-terminal domain-containing protein n=1 Tax=Mucilaginibacter lappiensis TaxID=354630 RepID=A0A841JM34_9SPHI|nr:hypothetical protein [Mucilaginibacter lappiensis]MBB6128971.1 hypothetical protein [Mucilaginibacter lappiensis]
MKFNVFTQMQYEARSEGTLVLNIHALRTPNQLVLSEELTIDPYLKAEELIAIQGESRLMRVELTEPCSLKITYRALVDNCYELHDFSHLPEALVSQLPATVLHLFEPEPLLPVGQVIPLGA